jgi:peptidoglycan-associated lipoprotein
MRPRPRTLVQLALIGLATLAITACASHQKPAPPSTSAPSEAGQPPVQEGGPQALAQPGGPTPGSVQDFVINVGELVYFDFDKYDIRADAAPILAAQAGWLSRYALVSVRIEGNCDERGTREYNFALGARRAAAVRQFLIDHGVAGGRITTISYGKEQPIDPGQDETAWAKDRNAHTAITGGAR